MAPLELRSESDELTSLDEMLLSSGRLVSSQTLSVRRTGGEGAPSFPFSAEAWMETWSAGKAVLQGMGLEMTRDFLFFDLLDVLFEETVHLLFLDLDFINLPEQPKKS